MEISERVAIVTGAGHGIGAALAVALAEAGARVLAVDLDADAATATAEAIGPAAIAAGGDASDPATITRWVRTAESELGPVDLYVANAGIYGPSGLGEEDAWASTLAVNLHAHVRAARILLPDWLERGSGYFVSTASAAGLLTQLGMAAYTTSKHAAVGFAEWLSITYGDRGIGVSCLCPMGVATHLLDGADPDDPLLAMAVSSVSSAAAVLQPAAVAGAVLEAVTQERFLVLPHPEVAAMAEHRGSDHDRWLAGMRRYQASLSDSPPDPG